MTYPYTIADYTRHVADVWRDVPGDPDVLLQPTRATTGTRRKRIARRVKGRGSCRPP